MKKYIIFYSLDLDYNKVLIEAKSLKDAVATADAFSRKTGAIVVGVCSELLIKIYSHGL